VLPKAAYDMVEAGMSMRRLGRTEAAVGSAYITP
jgi:hypothetical protein